MNEIEENNTQICVNQHLKDYGQFSNFIAIRNRLPKFSTHRETQRINEWR